MDTMTASEQSGATPSSDYSYRPPSPPHIHVAPHREDGDLVLLARDQYYGDEGDNIPHDELRLLTQGNHNAKPNDNWQYETRREAQAILPFLYLGPSSSARNITALQENGITLLLVIRDKTMAQARMLSGQKIADQLGIEAQAIDVSGNQELIHAFPQAVRVINNHLHSIYRQKRDQQQPTTYQRGAGERRTWGKVLVFCESGNERSACVVAAYIMQMYDCSLVGAIQWVQRQRFCVAFDDGLKTLLSTYQQYLEAKKSVFQDHSQQQIQNNKYLSTHPAKLKRGRDDINADDDMEMTGTGFEVEDDLARFDGRRAFTPFS